MSSALSSRLCSFFMKLNTEGASFHTIDKKSGAILGCEHGMLTFFILHQFQDAQGKFNFPVARSLRLEGFCTLEPDT